VQTKENENGGGKRPDATRRLGATRNKLMTVSRQWVLRAAESDAQPHAQIG